MWRNANSKVKSWKPWKPVTLGAPLLLIFATITLCFLTVLECLSRSSHRNGGIAFAYQGFSTTTTFTYLYLPTIFAVIYSLAFSWIDLDSKRLEPYFQMSRVEGARPKDSLFLHYPFDFVAYVPFKALRRRHWSVFFAGTSMTIIFWAITPLTSSVFASVRLPRIINATAVSTVELMDLESQRSALNTGFLMTAYGVVWLGQNLPKFTTNRSAILPFSMESSRHLLPSDESWTAETTMYSTALACKPAIGTTIASGISYSDGDGCELELGLNPSTDLTALYVGWYMDSVMDFGLSEMGCSSEKSSHKFLAYFSQDLQSNALFCTPIYWMEKVNATVMVANMSIIDTISVGPREPLTESFFNISHFEYLIATGAVAKSERADISDTSRAIDQRFRLQDIGIGGDRVISGNGDGAISGNMVGYALGLTRLDSSKYLDPDTLVTSFESAHQLLFALAIGTLFSPNKKTSESRPGVIRGPVNAIVIVRTLAIIVEAFLGLVSILTFALLYLSLARPSQLRGDPASLKDVLNLLDPDSEVTLISDKTSAANEKLIASIDKGKLTCQSKSNPNPHRRRVEGKDGYEKSGLSSIQPLNRVNGLVRPLEIRLVVAVPFAIILLLAAITVITLNRWVHDHSGMALPSSSPVVNQLVTNYLPVAFATFLEPFWLLLNRALCVLLPFEELRTGEAKASRSLSLKYTSLPPQLVLWRAFRAHQFILVAVCATGLSANVLSVALGGLFTSAMTVVAAKDIFIASKSSVLEKIAVNTLDSGPIYITKANISDGTSLPPWVSEDTHFLPFEISEHVSADNATTTYKAVTQGFGVNLTCAPAEYNPAAFITNTEEYEAGGNPQPITVPREFSGGQGSLICLHRSRGPDGGQNNSISASEVIVPLDGSTAETKDICSSLLLVGFLRANLTVSRNNVKTDNSIQVTEFNPHIFAINSLSSLWMICQPRLMTAPYSVTVDKTGRIKEYTQVGPYATDLKPFFRGDASLASLFYQIGRFWESSQDAHPYWHNDNFVDTWLAYFIKKISSSNEFIDPSKPVPSFDAIYPFVNEIYKRIFAVMLGQNPDWFADPQPNSTIVGTRLTLERRVFMSRPAYIITLTLLCINLIVAIVYYAKRPKKMLRSHPTTIASVLELFDGSGLIREAQTEGGLEEEWKLGYGRFVGTDGKLKVGIERRPFVIPWGDE